uniref:Uncharacterized protein n=1 Tax=Solanum lycopersicum TaxID=4081 RepID=A0A3Q7JL17_SOLLC
MEDRLVEDRLVEDCLMEDRLVEDQLVKDHVGGMTRPLNAMNASPDIRDETTAGITATACTKLVLQWILVKGFRLYSFQLPDSWSPAPSPKSNTNSPSPVTTMGRNLNDASPARWTCDPSSYHESSQQLAEPASTFYLINASLPEVGDQLGSIPQKRHAPHETGMPFQSRSGLRRARQLFTRSIRIGQIEADEGPMPTISTVSENSRRRSRTMPLYNKAREGVGRESVFWDSDVRPS